MNDKDILLLSATYPINTGPIAPPTGDIIKKEEARLVLFSQPFQRYGKNSGKHDGFEHIYQKQSN